MLIFLAWLALAFVSLPLALLALVLYPIVWVLALPFRPDRNLGVGHV